MKKYNLSNIMKKAWDFFRATGKSFAECLRMAWYNAKAINTAKENAGITEECHTWYAWKMSGVEVAHDSKALFKVEVLDHKTKTGKRILSYFGLSQVTMA